MARTSERRRLGVLTPASNTNAEPLTYAMLADVRGVTAHFSRFALPPLDAPLTAELLLDAARLLAELDLDLLVLHGTSGSWLGIDADREVCDALAAVTGVAATTASIATLEALRALGARRVALVFPGPAEFAARIAKQYESHGIECPYVRDGGLADNRAVGALGEAEVTALLEPACAVGADAVVVVGTNFPAAHYVDALERRRGVPVVDSAAATLWWALRLVGRDDRLAGWGRLLAQS